MSADLIPLEIKSASTINSVFFKGLKKFKSSTDRVTEGILIYGGSETKVQNGVQISNPGSMTELLDAFLKIGIVQ